MVQLNFLAKVLAHYPPDIKATVLELWRIEIQYRDLPTQLYFLGQYVPFTLALVTVGLKLPRQETERAIFILERIGCLSSFSGKYQSKIKCQIPPLIVTRKKTFRETHHSNKEKQPVIKNLKLRELLGVA